MYGSSDHLFNIPSHFSDPQHLWILNNTFEHPHWRSVCRAHHKSHCQRIYLLALPKYCWFISIKCRNIHRIYSDDSILTRSENLLILSDAMQCINHFHWSSIGILWMTQLQELECIWWKCAIISNNIVLLKFNENIMKI